jgi:hypothetical protein
MTASLIASLILVAAQGGFGAEEIPVLLLWWGLPLSLVIGITGLASRRLAERSARGALIAAGLGGPALGILWTYGTAALFGVWFLLLSVPPLPAMIASSTAGLLASMPRASRWSRFLGSIGGGLGVALVATVILVSVRNVKQDPPLIAVFEQGTTVDEINHVWENEIGIQTGRGTDLLPGIHSVSAAEVDGRDAIEIAFFADASDEDIERVRRALEQSPVVDEIRVAS